jgi:hypothetical protein
MFLCIMPLPAWGRVFLGFYQLKILASFFKKRCTQLTIMCNMPARREERHF